MQDIASLVARLDERSISTASHVQYLSSEHRLLREDMSRQIAVVASRQTEADARLTEVGHHLKTALSQIGDNRAAITELQVAHDSRRERMLDLLLRAGPWLIAIGGTIVALVNGKVSLPAP